jgi:hypothetical protein
MGNHHVSWETSLFQNGGIFHSDKLPEGILFHSVDDNPGLLNLH